MNRGVLSTVFCIFILSSGANADPNVQPYTDKDWLNAKCRFHVLAADGAYGSHTASSLDGCVASAEISLIVMSKSEESEAGFHDPAEVEFVDSSGTKHVCQLQSKKQKFDRLQDLSVDEMNQPGYYDSIDPGLKQVLADNFDVSCQPHSTQ